MVQGQGKKKKSTSFPIPQVFYCPCYGKSVKSTSSSFQVRFPSRLLGVRHESSTDVWVQIYCRSWFGLHDVANTHAWNAVVFIWHQCPTTHGASKHTSVNMTAKRPPFFSFFFFFFEVRFSWKSSLCVRLTVVVCYLYLCSNLHVNNLVDAKPFGQGGPAMHEVSLAMTVARTKGRRTRAAWPRWEEGGRVRGCCRSRSSPVWELRG